MYLQIFLADFAVFRGISRKYLNFAGPRPREISEALFYPSIMLKDFIPLDIHSLIRDYDPLQMKAWQMCDSLHHVSTSNPRQNPVSLNIFQNCSIGLSDPVD